MCASQAINCNTQKTGLHPYNHDCLTQSPFMLFIAENRSNESGPICKSESLSLQDSVGLSQWVQTSCLSFFHWYIKSAYCTWPSTWIPDPLVYPWITGRVVFLINGKIDPCFNSDCRQSQKLKNRASVHTEPAALPTRGEWWSCIGCQAHGKNPVYI